LAALDVKVNDWTTKAIEAQEAAQKMTSDIRAKENEEKATRKRRDDLRIGLAESNHALHGLTETKKSALNKYDKKMTEVVAAIHDRRRQFKDMPIGPIGMHVKLLKEEWAHICENIFGKSLNGFIVKTYDDSHVLQKILDEKKW
jgi:chromosome segregation ATPase